MLWNYFVSELRQSASQNLSKKDGAVKTATFFSERFCESDWRKFRNKEAARQPPWLTDGIDGRGLCTLIFSVDALYTQVLVRRCFGDGIWPVYVLYMWAQ